MSTTPTIFPFRHDWGQPFVVTREFATDVQRAFDGTEVRSQLRAEPNIGITMRCVFLNERGIGALLAWWRSATRPLLYYAPIWCDASDLGAAITAGDTSVTTDTTTRPFFALPDTGAAHAMIFRDEAHAEIVAYSAFNDTSLTLGAGTANSYARAGTRVVPVRPMWLAPPVNVRWQSNRIAAADVSFTDLRAQAAYGYAGASTTATPAALVIHFYNNISSGTNSVGPNPYDTFAVAIVTDDNGVEIPEAVVTWLGESDDDAVTVVPAFNTRFARVHVATASTSARVTATCGAISHTTSVN